MTDKTGGPAFPSYQAFEEFDDSKGEYVQQMLPVGGATLRDYFAGCVLIGMAARDSYDPGQATPQQRASVAYIDADAMIAERNKEIK